MSSTLLPWIFAQCGHQLKFPRFWLRGEARKRQLDCITRDWLAKRDSQNGSDWPMFYTTSDCYNNLQERHGKPLDFLENYSNMLRIWNSWWTNQLSQLNSRSFYPTSWSMSNIRRVFQCLNNWFTRFLQPSVRIPFLKWSPFPGWQGWHILRPSWWIVWPNWWNIVPAPKRQPAFIGITTSSRTIFCS